MDFEGLAELLIPLTFLAIVGGLIALRMLKPYGNRILELIKEIQEERHQALAETRDMQQIRDRLDMLAERQDFLEALVKHRLDDEEQERLERLRREELGPAAGGTGTGSRVGEPSAQDEGDGTGSDAAPDPSGGRPA